MYGLAAWDSVVPFDVPPRRLNPLDEDILVVDRAAMELLKVGRAAGSLFDIHYRELLNLSRSINRVKAEDDPSLVQLIPSFLIFDGDSILSFKRTRKTPEQRLHNTSSIVFGGHLQADDVPALFVDDDLVLERFLFRELHEELAFDPPLSRTSYVGVLHLDSTDFERQHAGVVFAVELHPHTRISSLEPGYHSTLHFFNWDEITSSPVMQDRWSATCITHMLESE
jgi:predicted NUDIX family phosphoesterase